MANPRDFIIHLMARQLAALTGFRTLCNLDLKLLAVDTILGGDTKTSTSHLLDGAATAIPIGKRLVAGRILPTLSAIALSAQPVHGNGHGLVGFATDGPKRHGTRAEAFNNRRGRLHFIQRNRGSRDKPEHPAQGKLFFRLIVDQPGIVPVKFGIPGSRCMLKIGNGFRRPEMPLPVSPEAVLSARGQDRRRVFGQMIGFAISGLGLGGDFRKPDSPHPGGRSLEITSKNRLMQADCLENLGAPVTTQGRNAHLGHDFPESLAERRHIVFHRPGRSDLNA